MEHGTWNGMKRNKTKTKKLTQPVRSVHKAQHCRCRCLCLCCRLCCSAQTKNAAATNEVERAKSSWVSHTSTACLMRNKMVMEHFCVNIHKHTYILYMCMIHTYMHTSRFAHVWNVLYIGQKQLRCQRWDWPLTTSYKRSHTQSDRGTQHEKATRLQEVVTSYIHTYICIL